MDQAGTTKNKWMEIVGELGHNLAQIEYAMSAKHSKIDTSLNRAENDLRNGIIGNNGYDKIVEECQEKRADVIDEGLAAIEKVQAEIDAAYRWSFYPNPAALPDKFDLEFYKVCDLTQDEYEHLLSVYDDNITCKRVIRSIAKKNGVELSPDKDIEMVEKANEAIASFMQQARLGVSDLITRQNWGAVLTKFTPRLYEALHPEMKSEQGAEK